MAGEKGMYGTLDKIEDGSALLGAGGDGGPDAFAPALAGWAARALGDPPIDHHETDCLLGQVVGRFDAGGAGGGDEAEVGVAVLAETVGHVLRLGGPRRMLGGAQQILARLFEGALESPRRHGVTLMDHAEQLAQVIEQALAVLAGRLAQRREVLHVADQVGQAKLHRDVEAPGGPSCIFDTPRSSRPR